MRRILWIFALLAGIFFLSLLGIRPSSPRRATAPPAEFSAVRALDFLHRVLPDELPHPAGSEDAEAVRKRILGELTQLGYKPEVHTGVGCGAYGDCATVNNIVARLDPPAAPAGANGAVLLACHYDSVLAGPGFSDDGVGIAATLEIARALKAAPPLRHAVIFLIDEGEEDGLLGARAFVDSDPWAPEVRAAVNMDARGTSGPSLMFETGASSGWPVRLFARRAVHPIANSLFYTVYKLLPSDTDLTVFKSAGYEGLNFAFIGNVAQYHTPLDNAENVSAASLQHQGESALAALVSFANADLTGRGADNAVFFDLFGQKIISWTTRRSVQAVIVLAVLLAVAIGWLVYRAKLGLPELLWGAAAWLSALVFTALAAFVLWLVFRLAGALPVAWIGHPLPLEATFWSLGVMVPWINARFFSRRAGFWGLWAGSWVWWGLLAILSLRLPGVSYLPIVTLAAAIVCAIPAILFDLKRRPGLLELCLLAPAAVAAALAFPLLLLLYPAAGHSVLVIVAPVLGVLVSPLIPLEAELRSSPGTRGSLLIAVPLTIFVLCGLLALVMPPFSAKSPERLNIEYWSDADAGQSQWIVEPASGRLPDPLRAAATFKRLDHGAFPWDPRPSFVSGAPDLDLAPPTFTILAAGTEDGRRNYRMLLRSERGAPYAAVFFPPDANIQSPRMADQDLPPAPPRLQRASNGWRVFHRPPPLPKESNCPFRFPSTGRLPFMWRTSRTVSPRKASFSSTRARSRLRLRSAGMLR